MEIFNEATILSISYHLILLTDYCMDINIQNMVGKSMLALTGINVMVNLLVMLVKTMKQLKRDLGRVY